MDRSQDLSAWDYLRPIIRFRWWAAAIVLFITAAVYGNSSRQPEIYESSTRILLVSQDSLSASAGTFGTDRTVQNQLGLLSTEEIARDVARRLGRPELAGAYAGSIAPSSTEGSDFITISAQWTSAREAARIANAYAQAFIDLRTGEQRARLERAIEATQDELDRIPRRERTITERAQLQETIRRLRLDLSLTAAAAEQVNPAQVPGGPVSPRPRRDALVGFFVALIGAIALAYALAAFDRRLRRIEDVAEAYDLPVLAVLPRVDERSSFVEARAAIPSGLQEPLRHLRTNIRLAVDEDARLLLVTSAVAQEGKSTVARNLAIAFRNAGASVAVVDADLRRPTVAEALAAPAAPGITDVLVGDVNLQDALASVPVYARGLRTLSRISGSGEAEADDEILDVLPAGPQPADPEAVLASMRLSDVLDELARTHDIVIVDSAPVLNVADTVPLIAKADAMILVARAGHVTRDNARRLRETLERLPEGKPLGVVVNQVATQDGYGYGYSYGYGKA